MKINISLKDLVVFALILFILIWTIFFTIKINSALQTQKLVIQLNQNTQSIQQIATWIDQHQKQIQPKLE